MTVRVRPTTAPKRRHSGDSEERFQRRVTIGFIVLIVAVVLILIGAVALAYYDAHFKPVASVGATGITRDQWTDRVKLESLRLDYEERQVNAALSAGQIDATTATSRKSAIQAAKQNVATQAVENLIDLIYKGQLAAQKGITVSEADVQAKLAADGSTPESRQVQAVFVQAGASRPGVAPTPVERQKALQDAQAAAAELAKGTPFNEVAAKYSTDASKDNGGDYGFITATNDTDAAWVKAIFSLKEGETTPVIKGSDGVYRIGRVAKIVPGQSDLAYQQDVTAAIGQAAYHDNVAKEALASALESAIVKDATSGNVDQVRLAEIFIATTTGEDPKTDQGRIHASHILYSPNDDPTAAANLDAADPAWTAAQLGAQKTADLLKAITNVDERTAKFVELAKAESDDKTSGAEGGDLSFFGRSQMVAEFAAALFDNKDLKPGDIVGPVKTQFGYHVILFQERIPPSADRLKTVTDALAASGADFGAIAKEHSDGDEAVIGGELGWRTKGQLPADAATAIDKVQPTGTTPSVTLDDGYHIYNVEERASRPLDAQQVAEVSATAFSDWYDPQKTKAETDKVITRDSAIFGTSGTP